MKNKFLVVTILMFAFVFLAISSVKAEEKRGLDLELENIFQSETSNLGQDISVQAQNKNEVRAQNENRVESSVQIRVQGEDEEGDDLDDEEDDEMDDLDDDEGDDDDKEDNEKSPKSNREERNRRSEERRSVVANAVQEMLQVADRTGGIGEQVRVIAQNQAEVQAKLENKLAKVENQSGLAKFFFGPKYNEIIEAEEILAQNKEQITALSEVQAEIENEEDRQVLMDQIELLEKANIEIEARLEAHKESSENSFSLFGWVSKIFGRK